MPYLNDSIDIIVSGSANLLFFCVYYQKGVIMPYLNDSIDIISNNLSKIKSPLRTQTCYPDKAAVAQLTERLIRLMFPLCADIAEREELLSLYDIVRTQIKADNAEELALDILNEVPKIKALLCKDIEAMFNGDPSVTEYDEIVISYPGFFAIAAYRIAHEFYKRHVPYVPRIITEYAHGKTGVDINAGASIGEYFAIDHGTGIVIGETTVIGNRVKLYQGVTLGARSFELDSDGNPVKGKKRHPNIEDNCVIYANATILGGNTVIGEGSVIGGNVWITDSVPAGSIVYYGSENRTKISQSYK